MPSSPTYANSELRLRLGDVLLSKSGTIGKVGLVRNGAVGAIAASGLFVLRPDQDRLDPHFLIAYLESSECRSFFSDKARGAYVQHLSKRVLDELSMPLPHLQLQQRVANEYREHGVDALTFLSQLLTVGERDPISEWIEKVIERLPADKNSINDPLGLAPLERLANEVRSFNDADVAGAYGDSPVLEWALQFDDAMQGLRNVRYIPRGPALLSVLQASARDLRHIIKAIKGYLPIETKARDITWLIKDWLDLACSALLNDVKLVLSTNAGPLQVGEMAEISIQVHNHRDPYRFVI